MSSDASGQRMLEVRDLGVSIAAVQILRGVSLAVPDQAMIGLIGRNGAGKTTLMKTLMGLHRAASGSVQFNDAHTSYNRYFSGVTIAATSNALMVVENWNVSVWQDPSQGVVGRSSCGSYESDQLATQPAEENAP